MDNKAMQFFGAAIDKTKAGTLSWIRIPPSRARPGIDYERSFLAQYGTGDILLLRDSTDDTIYCLVKPDKDLSYQQVGEDDNPMLIRLYNVVYSQFPSVESFIDRFIQGD